MLRHEGVNTAQQNQRHGAAQQGPLEPVLAAMATASNISLSLRAWAIDFVARRRKKAGSTRSRVQVKVIRAHAYGRKERRSQDCQGQDDRNDQRRL